MEPGTEGSPLLEEDQLPKVSSRCQNKARNHPRWWGTLAALGNLTRSNCSQPSNCVTEISGACPGEYAPPNGIGWAKWNTRMK